VTVPNQLEATGRVEFGSPAIAVKAFHHLENLAKSDRGFNFRGDAIRFFRPKPDNERTLGAKFARAYDLLALW